MLTVIREESRKLFGGKVLLYSAEASEEIKRAGSDELKERCVKQLFGSDTGARILKYPDGRPYVSGSSDGYGYVSVSHTGKYFVCAFSSSGRIGIDCELTDRFVEYNDIVSIAEKFYTCSEREKLIAFSASTDYYREEFIRIWTAKEAYVKMNGTGLGGMKNADSLFPENASIVSFPSDIEEKLFVSAALEKI